MGCQRTVLLLSGGTIGWDELRRILADLPDVRAVGDTADPAEARRLAAAHCPDAIIAAAVIAGQPTLPLLADLRRSCCPAVKAILFAADYAPSRLRSPEDTGVVGYLLWSDLSPAVVRHCLAAAIAGDIILGSGRVVRQFVAGLRGEGAVHPAAAGITARERAVLGRLAAGLTREEIAAAEKISLTTVKRLIADLESRLDAPNQFMLAALPRIPCSRFWNRAVGLHNQRKSRAKGLGSAHSGHWPPLFAPMHQAARNSRKSHASGAGDAARRHPLA